MKITRLLFIFLILMSSCRRKGVPPSIVTMQWDTLNYLLESCSATLENGQLKLYIDQHPDSLSICAVEILQKDREFEVMVSQTWGLTDSSYVPRRFKILNQSIQLNQSNYNLHDEVKGELTLLLLGHKDYFRERGEMNWRENWDTVRIFGGFNSNVR